VVVGESDEESRTLTSYLIEIAQESKLQFRPVSGPAPEDYSSSLYCSKAMRTN
jgi:hypothetical protein